MGGGADIYICRRTTVEQKKHTPTPRHSGKKKFDARERRRSKPRAHSSSSRKSLNRPVRDKSQLKRISSAKRSEARRVNKKRSQPGTAWLACRSSSTSLW